MEGLIFGPFFWGIFFSKYQVEAFQVSSHLLGFGGLLSLLSGVADEIWGCTLAPFEDVESDDWKVTMEDTFLF